jgi:hypothetical protein
LRLPSLVEVSTVLPLWVRPAGIKDIFSLPELLLKNTTYNEVIISLFNSTVTFNT